MTPNVPIHQIGGDMPDQTMAMAELYRRDRLRRRFKRLLAVPPPSTPPKPEDFPPAVGGHDE